MKIPKYVETLIKQRTFHAALLMKAGSELDDWLDKNGIECEDYDTHTGVEIYCSPFSSGQRVREAILNHKKD